MIAQLCANRCVYTDDTLRLSQFEAIASVSYTLVRTSLLNVTYLLCIAISTPIALTAMWRILRIRLQLMAQSTFNEDLVRLYKH